MSVNLIPVGSIDNIPVKYKPINMTGAITSSLAYEHNRNMYMGCIMDANTFRIQKMNLMTNVITPIMDLALSSLYHKSIGGMVVDDDNIYLTTATSSDAHLYAISLSTLQLTIYTLPTTLSGLGRMEFMNDGITLVLLKTNGLIMFNTKTKMISEKTTTPTYNRVDLAVGDKYIMIARDTRTTTIDLYSIADGTFSTITMPASLEHRVCYYNKKFYIVMKYHLVIFDEDTATILNDIATPWLDPKNVTFSKNVVFVIVRNSNILWMYDLNKNIYRNIILQWNIDAHTTTNVTIPCAFKGYYFLPKLTLCIVDYTGESKYNVGYAYDIYNLIINVDDIDNYEYDSRFITFKDTYLYFHDGDITFTPTVVSETKHIKRVSISKFDYKKFNKLKFNLS